MNKMKKSKKVLLLIMGDEEQRTINCDSIGEGRSEAFSILNSSENPEVKTPGARLYQAIKW